MTTPRSLLFRSSGSVHRAFGACQHQFLSRPVYHRAYRVLRDAALRLPKLHPGPPQGPRKRGALSENDGPEVSLLSEIKLHGCTTC